MKWAGARSDFLSDRPSRTVSECPVRLCRQKVGQSDSSRTVGQSQTFRTKSDISDKSRTNWTKFGFKSVNTENGYYARVIFFIVNISEFMVFFVSTVTENIKTKFSRQIGDIHNYYFSCYNVSIKCSMEYVWLNSSTCSDSTLY